MVQISRVLHAGYLLSAGSTRILFDPIFENPFSANCYAYPPVFFQLDEIRKLEIDAVFISHYHDDHFSLESLQHLKRSVPIYLFTIHDIFFELLKKLGFKNIFHLDLNQKVIIKEFEITPLEALDRDTDCLFQIEVCGLTIVNVVDSWIGQETLEKLLELETIDLILWPFQSMQELEILTPLETQIAKPQVPTEHLEQLKQLQPKNIIPSSCQFVFESWSWLNQRFFPISYAEFEFEIRKILPDVNFVKLDPGETICFKSNRIIPGSKLAWVQRATTAPYDYNYDSKASPKPLREISVHFPSLSQDQKTEILKICKVSILRKLNQSDFLSSLDEEFIWNLKIHWNNREFDNFFYKINPDKVDLIESTQKSNWRTEILGYKFWSSVSQGESLSSLYLQIFCEPPERVLEDPLIYFLYHRKMGSYQRAQLNRIIGKILV